MLQSKQAEIVLQTVILNNENKNVFTSSKITENYFVIFGGSEPRWIVPANPLLGKYVLAQWRPYGFFSQIAWFVLRRLYSLGMASLMPIIKPLTIESTEVLQLPDSNIEINPVVYIGTPGPQQKVVATLVDTRSGKALAVMKVALGVGARESLKREAEILESLDQLGVKKTPKLLAVDEDNGRTWQTVVSGCLSPRKLTECHISWLLSLPKSKKTTTLDKQKAILIDLVNQADANLSSGQLIVINKVIENIKGQKVIPLLLVHGDFVPWNIKQQSNGHLAVIDWEDAELEGLPLWDLCHFHFMQAHLFGESKQLDCFLFGALTEQYLRGLEIDKADKMHFVRLYLLGVGLQKGVNSSEKYQEFLIKQITRLVV